MIISRLRAVLVFLSVVLGAQVTGCSQLTFESDVLLGREFVRLNSLVRQLQQANNRDKDAPLSALGASECQSLCSFRDSCHEAYEQHVSALHQLAAIREQLLRAESETRSVSAELNDAQVALTRARPLLAKCAAVQGELERKLAR